MAGHVIWDRHRIRPSKQAKQNRSRGRSSADNTPPIDRYDERIGADEVTYLVDGHVRGDQLALDLRVDTVEAGVVDRRRADAQVYLGRAGCPQQADDLARRRAAHDRVVDDDQALTAHDFA